MSAALSLPDLDALDPAALKAMILLQQDRYIEQQDIYRSEREQYAATLNSRSGEIERHMLLVEKLKHMLFDKKSEKVLRQIEQLELQLEELNAARAVEELHALTPMERPAARSRSAGRCLNIFRAKCIRTCLRMMPAPIAVACCANSAKTPQKC